MKLNAVPIPSNQANNDIAKAVIMGEKFYGEFKVPQTLPNKLGTQIDGISHFKLTLPFIDRKNTEEWHTAVLEYTFNEQKLAWTG